jgi:hypothetical protein
LLLTHVRTVFVANVAVAQLRLVAPFVVWSIQAALAAEGLRRGTFGDPGAAEVTVAKTADRRITGTMKDVTFTACHVIGPCPRVGPLRGRGGHSRAASHDQQHHRLRAADRAGHRTRWG